MKGRPPKPTILKKLAGTDQPCRINDNEMQVSRLVNIPKAPIKLNDYGAKEFEIICMELHAKKMLHLVDLSLVTAYANEMGLYVEMENLLKQNGRIDEFYNEDGQLIRRTVKPEQRIATDSLNKALKIACQFGLTPSARTRISQPEVQENVFKI